MSNERAPVQVTTPTYGGVSVDHPRIISAIREGKKQGMTVEQLVPIIGMPREVVEKHWRNAPE
jgi:hypothetical protein